MLRSRITSKCVSFQAWLPANHVYAIYCDTDRELQQIRRAVLTSTSKMLFSNSWKLITAKRCTAISYFLILIWAGGFATSALSTFCASRTRNVDDIALYACVRAFMKTLDVIGARALDATVAELVSSKLTCKMAMFDRLAFLKETFFCCMGIWN